MARTGAATFWGVLNWGGAVTKHRDMAGLVPARIGEAQALCACCVNFEPCAFLVGFEFRHGRAGKLGEGLFGE